MYTGETCGRIYLYWLLLAKGHVMANDTCPVKAHKNSMNALHSTLTRCDMAHWLLITQHIKYKTALMTFRCVHGMRHGYFHGIHHPANSVKSRVLLRSAKYGQLSEPA